MYSVFNTALRAIRARGLIAITLFVPACDASKTQEEGKVPAAPTAPLLAPVQGEEKAATAVAPEVPPPIARTQAKRVLLELEVREHTKTLANGVTYDYWTFGEQAPGQFIRVREGDLIETRLSNHPDNKIAHNIQFQGATGPGGGADASFVSPGQTATFTWRAMRPGLFMYTCMAPPAGVHIANGMFGLILVEPKEGLPPVDREFQVVQSEFYTEGPHGERGHQRFSMSKALQEQPEYVVFNGSVGALDGSAALKAKVGETVRIYFGNAGPNLVSSFHVIGETFDAVYGEGGSVVNQRNVQTTVVPVGGSAIVEFKVEVPGKYQLVDHAMFRAFNKGAQGIMQVEGPENDLIFTRRTAIEAYESSTRLIQASLHDNFEEITDPEQMMTHGAEVYARVCAACHQADGAGVPGAIPPLARSDFLMEDRERAIRIVSEGLKGPIVVNGKQYDAEMPKPPVNAQEIASVLTYVLNSFGNKGDPVNLSDVLQVQELLKQGGDGKPASDPPRPELTNVGLSKRQPK